MSTELKYVLKNTHKIKETNCAKLYKKGDDLYKIIERDIIFYQRMINSIMYNYEIRNEVSKNLILPTDLVYDNNNVKGYKMDYVYGKTLDNFARDLTTEEKIKMLNNLTKLLEEINNYLVVGDVNLANCMYNKHNSYMIDFDLSTSLDKQAVWLSLYNFHRQSDKKEIISNLSTDKVKMGIIVASVLYGIDFERSFIFRKPKSKFNNFLTITNNYYFKDFFGGAFNALENSQNVSDYLYLPDNRNYIRNLEKDIKLIKERVK